MPMMDELGLFDEFVKACTFAENTDDGEMVGGVKVGRGDGLAVGNSMHNVPGL